MEVKNKESLSAKGWGKVKPHTREERIESMRNHGKKCFLKSDELKYPVCDKNGDYDCKGIIAAKFWADTAETKAKKSRKRRPYSFKKVSKSAKKLGKKLGCKKYKNTNKND